MASTCRRRSPLRQRLRPPCTRALSCVLCRLFAHTRARRRRVWSSAPRSTYQSEASEVVACDGNDFYHATLVKVDFDKNTNSYYTLQLLRIKSQYHGPPPPLLVANVLIFARQSG